MLFIVCSESPDLPSIRRCQSRLPLDVLALCSLAAMLELTLYPSLVVRRWCQAFLFGPLSMEEDFAEKVCQLLDLLRILRESRVWRSHPVSHQSSHWSPFRMGLANVPHLQKPAHIRCRDELLTNAANTDMKGCPIWCSCCPLAASLYAFPCALAAANGWNEATSPLHQPRSAEKPVEWASGLGTLSQELLSDDVSASLLIDPL